MIQMETLLMDKKGGKKKKIMKRAGSSSSSSCRKEEAMKVVYISNPMKFQIRASEFRSLVQQLTGQYADYPSLHHHYSPPPPASSNSSSCNDVTNCNSVGGEFHRTVGEHNYPLLFTPDQTSAAESDVDQAVEVVQQTNYGSSSCAGNDDDEDDDDEVPAVVQEDDVFVPEMLENSTLFYSWHLDMISS